MLVDDTPEMLFLYGKILRGNGYRVTEARTGLEALEVLDRDPPVLMVLDWMMPGMSGLEVLQQVRARTHLANLPVILLTAAGQREDLVTQVFDLGASDYITKPVNRRILLARVQAALDTRQKDELAAQSQQLSFENSQLLDELEQARKLQQAQLPPRAAVCGSWHLSGGLYPCALVGGDFFDIVDFTQFGCTIALVDVSGHGLAAAMVAAGIRSTLRFLAPNTPLERVLGQLNEQLCRTDDAHYACVALVKVTAHDVQIVNAGLPPVILMRGGRMVANVSASGVPPGLLPGSTYACSEFQLEPGLSVVMTSDGFTELFDVEGTALVTHELEPLLSSSLRAPWNDEVSALMQTKRMRQTDDATLVVLQHDGAGVQL